MPAVYSVKYATGEDGNPTWNSLPGSATQFRFKTNTDVDINLSNSIPIPVPPLDFNYSYWVSIALSFEGTFTQIDNIQHYCDGNIGWGLGTEGGLFINTVPNGLSDSEYKQSIGSVGNTGLEASANHENVDTMSNINTYNQVNRILIDSTSYTSPGTSKHIVLQVKVDSDATHGAKGTETMTFICDEI